MEGPAAGAMTHAQRRYQAHACQLTLPLAAAWGPLLTRERDSGIAAMGVSFSERVIPGALDHAV